MTAVVIQPGLFGLEQAEKNSDDYYTPAWVFERMGIIFDLDVCAPPGGISWIPAMRYFTKAEDGLAQPWTGRVWMNPPFSGAGPWVERFVAHGNGVCLVQHSRSRWHSRLWASAAAMVDPNLDLPSMFKFVRGDGYESVFMPVFLAAFGDECVEAISRLGRVRT